MAEPGEGVDVEAAAIDVDGDIVDELGDEVIAADRSPVVGEPVAEVPPQPAVPAAHTSARPAPET